MKNYFINEMNNMDNVKNFLLIEKGFIESTFKNRYNLLRRILIKISGNNNSLINDIKITETKKKKDLFFLNKNEKNEYLICLSNSNEFDLIIFHYFVFILGLNISELSILKVNNFSKNYSILKFYRNKKSIKRTIDKSFSIKLKLYIKKIIFYQQIIWFIHL